MSLRLENTASRVRSLTSIFLESEQPCLDCCTRSARTPGRPRLPWLANLGIRSSSQSKESTREAARLPAVCVDVRAEPRPPTRSTHHVPRRGDCLGQARGLQLGLAFGGNKVRKLEYLVPDALSKGADTLVSIGGVQPNHTREVAAVAAKLGFKCRLVQEQWVDWDDPVYDRVGNILLSRIMGADVRLDPAGFDIGIRSSWEEAMREVEEAGGTPNDIPAGGSSVRSEDSVSPTGLLRSRSRSSSLVSTLTRSSSAR